MAENKKLSIIAFSGDFDKLTAVFTLGTGAAAVGYEVNIFFTFWGLDAIKQKQGRSFTGGNWLTKIFGFMMGGLKVTPTTRFNFLGAGPKIFRYLMKKNNVATLEELVEAAKALGINMYACEMAMHVLGLKKEDFIPGLKVHSRLLTDCQTASTNRGKSKNILFLLRIQQTSETTYNT